MDGPETHATDSRATPDADGYSASAVVWRWRERETARPDPPAPSRARALVEAGVMTAVGLVLVILFGKRILGTIALVLAATVCAGGLFAPPLYRAFRSAGAWLGRAAGAALTWLLLAPFFYLCFGLGGWLLRLLGRDPLDRAFDREQATYWTPRKPIAGPEHFSRQY